MKSPTSCMWWWIRQLTIILMALTCPIGEILWLLLGISITPLLLEKKSLVETHECSSNLPPIAYGSIQETSSVHTLHQSSTRSAFRPWQATPFTHKALAHIPSSPRTSNTFRSHQMDSVWPPLSSRIMYKRRLYTPRHPSILQVNLSKSSQMNKLSSWPFLTMTFTCLLSHGTLQYWIIRSILPSWQSFYQMRIKSTNGCKFSTQFWSLSLSKENTSCSARNISTFTAKLKPTNRNSPPKWAQAAIWKALFTHTWRSIYPTNEPNDK